MTLQHLDIALGFAAIMLLMSLLITVIVQAAVAVSGLRGSNLKWGVAELFKQIGPSLAEHAQAIADRILHYPAIAPVSGRKATAIRVEELLGVVDQVMKSNEPWKDPAAKAALERVLNEVIADGDLAPQAEALIAKLAAQFPAQADALKASITTALGSTRKVVAGVNTWFKTIMDRTTERFVVRTRWITAIAAFLFAVILHVDSLQLLKRLASDSEFRSKVVAVSDAALQQAENVLAQTAESQAVASRAVTAARDQVPAARTLLGTVPTDLRTRAEGEAWIRERVRDGALADTVLRHYGAQFDSLTRRWLGELRTSSVSIDSQLNALTLQVIPEPFPSVATYLHLKHLIGILMTVGFLSLGAPFWFNVLNALANLRPVIARKVDKEGATTTS